jgi:uncharacterized protein
MGRDPTLLGTVQDVQGSSVSVALASETIAGLAFVAGQPYRIGQLGSFVRIPMGYVDLFGIVSQVGASAVPGHLVAADPYGHRWMTIQLIGEGESRGEFTRGLSQYPTVGDEVHLVIDADLSRIYGRADSPNQVVIGQLASAESIPALVDIDRLVTRHSAIVGATGAGKSTTVASLLLSMSRPSSYPSARILLLDMHGEYANALRDRATVFRLNPDEQRGERPLHVPYWAMTFDELLSFTFAVLDDAARGAIRERITDLKLRALQATPRNGVTPDTLTADSPVPFSIHKLWFDLYRLVNATHTASGGQSDATEALLRDAQGQPVQLGDALTVVAPRYRPHTLAAGGDKIYLSSSPLNIRRQVDALASKLRDPRFDFLFRPGAWLPNTEGVPAQDVDLLLADWLGGPQAITILDLSGVPVSIVNDLVGSLLRVVYDALFWSRQLSEGARERPLLVVLEEAHAYLRPDKDSPAGAAVRRIVKEGRKYGIGAMIISQRPSEIDSTVLSQCGTIFALRLSNPSDRAHITGATMENLGGLLAMLPALRTGEAIIVGEAVRLPIRALITPPPKTRRPDSGDPLIYNDTGPGGWNRAREPSDYGDVVQVWRRQVPRSPRAV